MSEKQETLQIILDTAEKIFADYCDKTLLDEAERGDFPHRLWQQVSQNGFDRLGAPNSGTDAQDMYALIKQSGRFAVPLPLAETLLVNRWCDYGEGIFSRGVIEEGQIVDVPWGRVADKVLGVSQNSGLVAVVDSPQVVQQSTNLAGDPRDSVVLPADTPFIEVAPDPMTQLAAARCNQMAGSAEAILALGLQFANERIQFGRPIAKFQAIQHSLAVVAAEVAAASRSADAAVDDLSSDRFLFEVAAAKSRVGEAVTIIAEQVHQVHGAMGFTHEHRLHHYSRRAWAWRDEYGNEFYWQGVLGAHLAGLGADHAWQFIATRG